MLKISVFDMSFEITNLKFQLRLPGANELNLKNEHILVIALGVWYGGIIIFCQFVDINMQKAGYISNVCLKNASITLVCVSVTIV